jgi:flagellar motor switch protein FliM
MADTVADETRDDAEEPGLVPGDDASTDEEHTDEETTDGAPSAAGGGPRRRGEARLFDFRRPQKFSREHVRALQIVHEAFARQVTTILSTTLRAVSQVQLTSVEEYSYGEYIDRLPNPTILTIVSFDPLPGVSALHLPLPLAMSAVDRILGGTGTGTYVTRPLTDIEEGLVRGQMERWLAAFADSFESLAVVEPKIVGLESNPQFAQIAAPSDMVVVIELTVHIGGVEAPMTLCIPFASLQPVLDRMVGPSMFAGGSVDRGAAARAIQAGLAEVPVDVSVRFGMVALSSKEILNLREGDVLPLQHPIGAPLWVTTAGIPVRRAMAGKRGRRLACVIVGDGTETQA